MPAKLEREPNNLPTLRKLTWLFGLLVAVLLFIPACEDAQTAIDSPDAGLTEQEGAIFTAVEAMAILGDGAEITVTDIDGTPYVRLTMDGSDVIANLPLSWLPEQQHSAAREAFADAGAAGASELPSAGSGVMFPEFSVSLGSDPDDVARFVANVLERAYALAPQEKLVFEIK